MNRYAQRGVALVITLIMLSVVTFMAIAFLALSRRERGSVNVTADQTTASLMADAALARAQAEIVGRLVANSNQSSYELMVSTNFYNPAGFASSRTWAFNPYNVNYERLAGPLAQPVYGNEESWIQNIANLQYDARPPVFLETNLAPRTIAGLSPPEFRFYWDFNRNGLFETNGWQVEIGTNGQALLTNGIRVTNFFIGDPEWIGVLEKPNLPHSKNNKFVGRYAYIMMPAGKCLDLNFIHNQAKSISRQGVGDKFFRNQGVGSWEINLAGFFRDLNTNVWYSYLYNSNVARAQANPGVAFNTARGILDYRYYTNFFFSSNSMVNFFGNNAAFSSSNVVDNYTDGILMTNAVVQRGNDNVAQPGWPGSINPRRFGDIQELFNVDKVGENFTLGISNASINGRSSYDRYTYYRMLAQIGVDSTPAMAGKLNINCQNDWPGGIPDGRPWPSALAFFANAAERIMRNQIGAGITNVMIYPTNQYNAAVHRCFQVAANIFDATQPNGSNAPPSVFRPRYRVINNQVFLNGFIQETNASFLGLRWVDLNVPRDRSDFLSIKALETNGLIYGIPLVIGVKKYLPNFNEFSLQTAVQVSRKVEIRKDARSQRPNQTNQMYMVGISNAFGLEAWNSYETNFNRQLYMGGRVDFNMALTTLSNALPLPLATNSAVVSTNLAGWPAGRFFVPLNTNFVVLSNAVYVNRPKPHFEAYNTNFLFEVATNFNIPQWSLFVTSRVQFYIIDMTLATNKTDWRNGRVLDFVNLNGFVSQIDISREIVGSMNFGESSGAGAFWQTNLLNGMPMGLREQVLTSMGQGTNNNDSVWRSYNQQGVEGLDKEKSIDLFRVFMGLNPLRYPMYQMQQEIGNSLVRQAPFTPTRKIYQNYSWQANDPLVHYTMEDLYDMDRTNNIQYAVPPSAVPTNSNLGMINRNYRPWGGNTNVSSDTNKFNIAVKDPMVRKADDWDFPTNKFPTLGWLGRVHRGTPWQTLYLKSPVAEWRLNDWRTWMVYRSAHPTNDWRLLDVFTTALNTNAASGLLSVNQTNLAAWSAIFSGVCVVSNRSTSSYPPTNTVHTVILPDSPQLKKIVEDINATRASRKSKAFSYLGEILATPALSTNSPYLNPQSPNITDQAYEWLPQQILSLLRADEPRIVVYAYGQTLAPAGRPVMVPGQNDVNYQVYTNYQIMSEVLTKHVLRIDGAPTNTAVVPESYQVISND